MLPSALQGPSRPTERLQHQPDAENLLDSSLRAATYDEIIRVRAADVFEFPAKSPRRASRSRFAAIDQSTSSPTCATAEPIETVRARIPEIVGRVAVPHKILNWHPTIDRLLKEDEKRREKQLASLIPCRGIIRSLKHHVHSVNYQFFSLLAGQKASPWFPAVNINEMSV